MINQTSKAKPNDTAGSHLLPEIWGGVECTINRVQNIFFDQLAMSGHYTRDADIDLIAGLGISRLRFPILWEKHEPDKTNPIDWSWTDNKLKQLLQHGITPIAGLVHHGSGPAFTSLDNQSFASGLAAYAAKVAQRYPWIQYYTPVNEPLTTARFSGLYGYWYPHKKSEAAFCAMLLNQLKGTVLAMQEIRKINPYAKLIQTEDLGKTYAVPPLQYQADFDNDRRWLPFDLLCGKVDKDHPLWDFFIRSAVSEDSLRFFIDNPCPPSILGLNYYVTSERFLDDRLENYPTYLHGGNWLERYVDIEAIRVNHGQRSGLRTLLDEVEERYNLPMAITESHLHCTTEEKMRWFKETWDICCERKSSGSPVKAVTAWSIFGAFGWNKLLTTTPHEYESGVFDLRGSIPQPTVMAKLIRSLATKKNFCHPLLAVKGWWRRPDRFLKKEATVEGADVYYDGDSAVILIIGEDGSILKTFMESCESRFLPHEVIITESDDSAFQEYIVQNIKKNKHWAIVHLADQWHAGRRISLAQLCKQREIPFLSVSAGQSDEVLRINPSCLIIKTGTLFDADSRDDLILSVEAIIRSDKITGNAYDMPTAFSYLPDVTNVSLDLLIDGAEGVWNLVNNDNQLMPSLENAFFRCREKHNEKSKLRLTDGICILP